MDTELIAIVVTHAIAFLGIVGVAVRFVAGQSARIARTEERIARLESDIEKLRETMAEHMRGSNEVQTRLARIEVQVAELQKGQERIIGLLDEWLKQGRGA